MKSAKLFAALTASALLMSPAFASESLPLAAGQPAGTKQAALLAASPFLFIGLAVAIGGIAWGVSSGGHSTTTTGTGS